MSATFIDIEPDEQCEELRKFMREQGSDISLENSDRGGIKDVLEIIQASSSCWKNLNNETEAEGIFNSIISLMPPLNDADLSRAVHAFCEHVGTQEKADKTSAVRLRIMLGLHNQVESRSGLGYFTYKASLQLAHQADLIQSINTDLAMIKQWMKDWECDANEQQEVYRLVHDAFLQAGQGENAMKAMLELLATHTEQSAAAAREDAHRCIVTSLKAPDTYLFDHLLSLKPVKFLEGSTIHDLLTIFVSGKYQDYTQFQKDNVDFLTSIGLDSEAARQKMQLLHVIHMAETRREVDFTELQEELDVKEEDLESFIIDLVRTHKVKARINQVNRKVSIQSTTNRTFARAQWQQLHEKLCNWRQQITTIENQLEQQMQMIS